MEKRGLAVIVGASQGIGECVAKGLAGDGYQPVLIARNGEKLLQLAESIGEATNQEPIVFPLDITDHKSTALVMDEIIGLGKTIDIVVNSAAAYVKGTLDGDSETVQRVLNANVVAYYAILQTLVPVLQDQKYGYIFTIASRAGIHGFPGVGMYSASKFALVGLCESLYRELAPFNVKLTTLCPGVVNTPMAKKTGTTLAEEEMIQPDDILLAIRFLLGLSKNACVRELMIESPKNIL